MTCNLFLQLKVSLPGWHSKQMEEALFGVGTFHAHTQCKTICQVRFENFPGMHTLHAMLFTLSVYIPAEQLAQVDEVI